jgi:hypothetical protein
VKLDELSRELQPVTSELLAMEVNAVSATTYTVIIEASYTVNCNVIHSLSASRSLIARIWSVEPFFNTENFDLITSYQPDLEKELKHDPPCHPRACALQGEIPLDAAA